MRYAVSLFAVLALSCSSDPETPPRSSSSSSGGLELAGNGTFRGDVVPIVRSSCALTACHASGKSNLGIHLTHDAAQLYAELQKESPTHTGVRFVVPGNPDQSLFYLKMEGTQATLGSKCVGTQPCGVEMPPGELLPKEQRDLVRRWIENGAKND